MEHFKDNKNQLSFHDSVIEITKAGFPNLFMMHAASGLVFPYLKLKALNLNLYAIGNPYYGLQLQFHSISEMAETYINFIRQIQPKGPYYLAGWSLGGVTALEMAKQLTAFDESVTQVIMIDSYNPVGKPRTTNARYRDAEDIIKQLKVNDQSSEANALREQYRIAHELLSQHNPSPYYGDVILLKALYPDPPEEDSVELNKWIEQRQRDPYNGWRSLLPNLQVIGIHTSHSRMFDADKVGEIITQLDKKLLNV